MNDLIIRDAEGQAIATKETLEKIRDFEEAIKELKAKEEVLKTRLLQEMEEKGVISLKSDILDLTYIEATTRESLDTKTLKKELPDIYNAYCKISPVKASIRIKVK